MIWCFGLDYQPLTMLWNVPQVCFSRESDVLGNIGHAVYHCSCFFAIFEARLAVSGRNYFRLAVSGQDSSQTATINITVYLVMWWCPFNFSPCSGTGLRWGKNSDDIIYTPYSSHTPPPQCPTPPLQPHILGGGRGGVVGHVGLGGVSWGIGGWGQ